MVNHHFSQLVSRHRGGVELKKVWCGWGKPGESCHEMPRYLHANLQQGCVDIKFRVICSNTMKVAQQRDLFSVPVLSWAHMRDKAGILLMVAGYVRRSMDITYLHGSTCPSTLGTQCKQCDQCVDIVYRDLFAPQGKFAGSPGMTFSG